MRHWLLLPAYIITLSFLFYTVVSAKDEPSQEEILEIRMQYYLQFESVAVPGIIWPLLTSLNGIFNKYEMIFQKGMDPSRSSFLMSFGRGHSTQIQRIPPPNRSLTLAVMGWMETETEWLIQTLRKISFIQWQLI